MPVVKGFMTANGISEALQTMKYFHGNHDILIHLLLIHEAETSGDNLVLQM